MDIIVDGIIFQLQARGGISRIFQEILPRMCNLDDSLKITLLTSARSKQPLPSHRQINHLPLIPGESFLRPDRLWRVALGPLRETLLRLRAGNGKGKIWHSTYYSMPCLGKRLSWNGPVITTVADMIHGKLPGSMKASDIPKYIRTSIEHSDKIIAISENTKQDIVRILGIPEETVAVIHLAASDFFQQSPEVDKAALRQRFRLNKPFILYVGKRWGYKNFRTLLEVYSTWGKRSEFDLVCIGGENHWSQSETEVIVQADLGDSVRLLQNTSDKDLRTFYSTAYVFVYPSLYEGFGIPPLEAMNCGTPVIVSNTSSIPEVVGDAGLSFDPGSKEALRDALNKLTDNNSLREELIEKSLNRSKMFDWQKTADATYNIYRDML